MTTRIAQSNTAYSRGRNAYTAGVPFHKNPYKDPEFATSWSVGWTDQRKWTKETSIPKHVKEKLGVRTRRPR